ASPFRAWHAMHATPGCIAAEPLSPPVQRWLLVQTVGGTTTPASGPTAGPPAPPSGGGGEVQAAGDPAVIQLARTAISPGVARAAGGGGIGFVASCMRASAISATVRDGLLREGATRSA